MSIFAFFMATKRKFIRDPEVVSSVPRALVDIVSEMERNGVELNDRIKFDKEQIEVLTKNIQSIEARRAAKSNDVDRASRIVGKINDFLA